MAIAPVAGATASISSLANAAQSAATKKAGGGGFVEMLDNLQGSQDKADGLAIKAATGELADVHSYTIAATEAALATELTVAVRNRAVESFNEIMRMPV